MPTTAASDVPAADGPAAPPVAAPAPPSAAPVDSPRTGPSRAVVVLAAVGAIAPFDLALPRDGWTALHVRPLMLSAIVVSVVILAAHRRRIRVGVPEAAIVAWLVIVWTSTAISDAPVVGAAGAIRLTVVGLLVVATRAVVVDVADARVVLRGLAVGVVAASVVGLVVWWLESDVLGTDRLVGSISPLGPVDRLTRPWSHANVAAMALGASLPAVLLFRGAWRTVALTVGGTALLLTYSRGAALAALVVAAVVFVVRRSVSDRRRLAGVVLLGAVVVAVTPGWAQRFDPPDRAEQRDARIEVPDRIVLEPDGVTIPVPVTNRSERTWPAGGPDAVELAARWVGRGQDWIWGEHRWPLPHALAPGETVVVVAEIAATVPAGSFDVRWDLVTEGDRYFLASLGRVTSSRGVVRDSPLAAADVRPAPLAVRRPVLVRAEIWRLAVGELLGAPLFGVGPSELAVAVDDEVGAHRRFLGRHAHSLLLEPLATTGVLGTVPLFVVLVGGLRRAARWAWNTRDLAPLAVLAGLTATLVHGLVDWPLVYTGAAIPVALLGGLAWTADEDGHRPR